MNFFFTEPTAFLTDAENDRLYAMYQKWHNGTDDAKSKDAKRTAYQTGRNAYYALLMDILTPA